jgi:hypothetical protein
VSSIDEERLTVAHAAAERLLRGLKGRNNLKGKALRRMKLVEEAVQRLEVARVL